MHRWFVVGLLATLALAGCIDDDGVKIAGQGSKGGTDTKTLNCDSKGHINVGVQGEGRVVVSVTDGDDREIYRQSFGSGQGGESSSLDGTKGKWTLRATFSGSSSLGFGSDFQGQWGITLTC